MAGARHHRGVGARQLALVPRGPVDTARADLLTARAVRLALWPIGDGADGATRLAAVAAGDRAALRLARMRIERTLVQEWSQVAARAAHLLRAAEAEIGA